MMNSDINIIFGYVTAAVQFALAFPDAFEVLFIAGFVAGILQSVHLCRIAVKDYKATTVMLEEYYAEDFNYMRHYQNRFIVAIAVGMSLLVAVPFMGGIFYVWRILFVAFYVYVAILFIGQGYNRSFVAQLYDRLDIKKSKPEAAGSLDRLGIALKKWVDKKNYLVSDVSTESIAEAVGINDLSNFKKTFAKLKGMSPNEWKENFAPTGKSERN